MNEQASHKKEPVPQGKPARTPRDPEKRSTPGTEAGVSEVVGEMLLIGLAVLLIAVFAAVLGNSLPTAHDPGVTVSMTNDTRHVVLWHKGGDWIKKEDLTVIIGNDQDTRFRYTYNNSATYTAVPKKKVFDLSPDKDVFDLGSNLSIDISNDFPSGLTKNETVSLVTPHAQVFSGKVRT